MAPGTTEVLTTAEVEKIHQILVADFEESRDPISPGGVKSQALLESAVGRQLAGFGGRLKYPDPLSNAATLCFGICCDHPFHNGNKRTALVALLVHLDKNSLLLESTDKGDLYALMLAIADNRATAFARSRTSTGAGVRPEPDEEIASIVHWLKSRTGRISKQEKVITFRRLRQCLARFQFEMRPSGGNTIEIGRMVTERHGIFGRKARTVWRRVEIIGYHDEGTEVSKQDIKRARSACQLTEADGVTSDAFYGDAAIIDTFINRYRTTLRRLART